MGKLTHKNKDRKGIIDTAKESMINVVHEFCKKHSISTENLQQNFLNESEDSSWVAAHSKGFISFTYEEAYYDLQNNVEAGIFIEWVRMNKKHLKLVPYIPYVRHISMNPNKTHREVFEDLMNEYVVNSWIDFEVMKPKSSGQYFVRITNGKGHISKQVFQYEVAFNDFVGDNKISQGYKIEWLYE